MRTSIVLGLLLAAASAPTLAHADDCTTAEFGPRGIAMRGHVVAVEWGAPAPAKPVKCPDGKERCFEKSLADPKGEPTQVRIVLDQVEQRDEEKGTTSKLARVVLDGVLPRKPTSCATVIEKGQTRELAVERAGTSWRIRWLRSPAR